MFKKLCLILVVLIADFTLAVPLRLEDDLFWVDAGEVSLDEVLRSFARLGVRVRYDPAIRMQVMAHSEGEPLDQVFAHWLRTVGYVLIWEQWEGPAGPSPRLAEIQVFRPESPGAAQPLEERNFLPVTQDSAGLEFVADELLIGFVPGSDTDAVRLLIRELGATVIGSIPELGIYQLRLAPGTAIPALVERLDQHPLVAAVEPNYVSRAPALAPSMAAPQDMPTRIPSVRNDGAKVAVMDTGWIGVPGYEGLVQGTFNAVFPDQPVSDGSGHGTHMAMVAAGAILPGGGIPSDDAVSVLSIRGFDDAGTTSNFAVMRGLFHAAEEGARVLNLSWGTTTHSEFLEHATQVAAQSGLVLVAAAGNEPTGQPMYPAAYPTVLAVGATLPDGAPWPNSNYGDFVALSAPGTAVVPISVGAAPAGGYAGTSIASAYVSRALGLYLDRHPHASPQEAVQALIDAADAGVLDEAAMQRLLQ